MTKGRVAHFTPRGSGREGTGRSRDFIAWSSAVSKETEQVVNASGHMAFITLRAKIMAGRGAKNVNRHM